MTMTAIYKNATEPYVTVTAHQFHPSDPKNDNTPQIVEKGNSEIHPSQIADMLDFLGVSHQLLFQHHDYGIKQKRGDDAQPMLPTPVERITGNEIGSSLIDAVMMCQDKTKSSTSTPNNTLVLITNEQSSQSQIEISPSSGDDSLLEDVISETNTKEIIAESIVDTSNDTRVFMSTLLAEKEAMLTELKDDLYIAQETVQQQLLATDIWQKRFDELATLAIAGKVDKARVTEIRNRSLVEQHWNSSSTMYK